MTYARAGWKESGLVSDTCVLCQQAVEKYLKAYLIRRNVDFGKTHNLEYLLELCAGQDEAFHTIDVGNLTFYAVEVRYPSEFTTPSIKEAKDSLKIAKHVQSFVLKKLKE